MRVWFDMTAPAHPIGFRPIIAQLQRMGHEVRVTARDYAQTLPLLERLGMPHTAIGRHGRGARLPKTGGVPGRTAAMIAFGRRGHFDLAVAHGSTDLALASAALR